MELSCATPRSAEEGLSLADDAVGRMAARGLVAELFLRGGPELTLTYEPSTGRTLESRGGALRATCRVWRDGQCGAASADAEGVADLLRLADAAHARAPRGPAFPVPEPAPSPLDLRPPPVDLSGARALALARALTEPLAGRGGRFQAVLIRQALTWTAVASTRGTRAADVHPLERALVRYETGHGALVDGVEGPFAPEPLDAGPAVERLTAGDDALSAPGGPPEPALPWALRPAVAAPLVSGLGWLLCGDIAEQTPGLLRSLGKRLFPSALILVDEAGARRADDEGEPSSTVRLVEGGRLQAFLHSAESAHALGAKPNGRGLRPAAGGEPYPGPLSLRVVPGLGELPPDRNDFVTRLQTFTTMARPGRVTLILAGWAVRGGERVRRIAPFEVELPLLETFRKLLSVGADLAFLTASEGCGTPTLVFASLQEKAL